MGRCIEQVQKVERVLSSTKNIDIERILAVERKLIGVHAATLSAEIDQLSRGLLSDSRRTNEEGKEYIDDPDSHLLISERLRKYAAFMGLSVTYRPEVLLPDHNTRDDPLAKDQIAESAIALCDRMLNLSQLESGVRAYKGLLMAESLGEYVVTHRGKPIDYKMLGLAEILKAPFGPNEYSLLQSGRRNLERGVEDFEVSVLLVAEHAKKRMLELVIKGMTEDAEKQQNPKLYFELGIYRIGYANLLDVDERLPVLEEGRNNFIAATKLRGNPEDYHYLARVECLLADIHMDDDPLKAREYYILAKENFELSFQKNTQTRNDDMLLHSQTVKSLRLLSILLNE